MTTDPSVLQKQKFNIKNPHFFFVPVDKNIECFNTYLKNQTKDIFYAMSHGVNRAKLKKGKSDSRVHFLDSLVSKLDGIKYDFYGFGKQEPVWGNDFYIKNFSWFNNHNLYQSTTYLEKFVSLLSF